MVVTPLKKHHNTKFKKLNDGLIFVDLNGIIHYTNEIINNIFEYNKNDLYNKNISILFSKPFSDKIIIYINSFKSEEEFIITNRFLGVKKNKNFISIDISLESYEFIGIKGVLFRLTKSTNDLINENSNDVLKNHTDFISKTSHELRNPLTTILNATTILNKIKCDSKFLKIHSKNINRIEKSITQLTKILDDFLTLNKIEGLEKNYSFETNILTFTNEIIENIKGGTTKKIYIIYNHSGNNKFFINTDMLSSIIHNLLSNATKYSPNRSIIEFNTIVNNNELVMVCKDNGIGVPNNEKKHLFKRYYRANNTTNIQGTGLGLCIIKEHLEKIGGKINFISQLNKGSTFTVTIPLKKSIYLNQIS